MQQQSLLLPQISKLSVLTTELTNEITDKYLCDIQEAAPKAEKEKWKQRGASQDPDKIWTNHDGLFIATTDLLSLVIPDGHGVDT